jgi:hypothetical protein
VQRTRLEIIQTVAQVASVIVATIAIVYAVDANKQSQLVFDAQLKQSERLAAANMAPLLYTRMQKIINSNGDTCFIEISIENTGGGTALINSFFAVGEFGDKENSIPAAIDSNSRQFVSRYTYIGSGQYVPPNDSLLLVRISATEIVASGQADMSKALEVIEDFQQRLSGVVLELEFSNVLRTKTQSMTSSFNRDRGRVIRTLNDSCKAMPNV